MKMDLEHLLAKAYDMIVYRYRIRSAYPLADRIAEVLGYKGGTWASTESYYSRLCIQNEEEAAYLWNEEVYNLFNHLAPAGYYFGSLEGDGACIGWFKHRDD